MFLFVRRLLRSRVLLAVLLPLAGKGAAAAGRRLEATRGPSSATRALSSVSTLLTPTPGRRRGLLGRLLGR